MKEQCITLVALVLLLAACADSPPRTSPGADTPWVVVTDADSFYVTGPNFGDFSFGFAIGESDTVALGTDGYQGGYLLLMTREDTVQFDYVSTPYQQHHLVSVGTQNFSFMGDRADWFNEALMFVSGPEDTNRNASLSEEQKEGLRSGVVFTEIDHNYVKFPQFNRKLAELYASKSEEETVADLYPPVLAWAATVR